MHPTDGRSYSMTNHVDRTREVARLQAPMGLVFAGLALWIAYAAMEVWFAFGDLASLSPSMIDTLITIEESWFVPFLLTGTSFLVWAYRAHRNLETALERSDLRFSHASAVWWWFVPIANLFMPYRVMHETARASTAPPEAGSRWRNHRLPAIAAWWTAFLLVGVLSTRWTAAMINSATTIDGLESALRVGGVAWGVMGVAAVLCGRMVYQLTRAQRDAAAAMVGATDSESETAGPFKDV